MALTLKPIMKPLLEFANATSLSVIAPTPLCTTVTSTSLVDKFLTEVQAQLDEKQVTLEVDDDARSWLSKEGYDEKMGARPMYRIIQDKIKKPLAEELIFGELSKNGGNVMVSVEDDELKIDLKSSPRKEEKKKEKV